MRLLTLRTVLVGTDLTPTSNLAVETAGRLAKAAGTMLHVTHVLPMNGEPDAPSNQRSEYTQRIESSVQHLAPGVTCQPPHLLFGEPAAVISGLAEGIGADLIVLGRHGPTHGSAGQGFGSTAYSVITSSGSPCLVVRQPLALPIRRVLVAIDFSESARGAMLIALAWASGLRSRAQEGDKPVLFALHVNTAVAESADEHTVLDHELDLLNKSAGGWAGVDVRGVMQPGDDPARGIVDFATHHDVDLVVLGTGGRALTSNPALGSVAETVTRGLDIPVLLVPPTIWHVVAHDLDEEPASAQVTP